MRLKGKKLKIAVVGATGAVGHEMLRVLGERRFPISELIPFASAKSEGKTVSFMNESLPCKTLKKGCFLGVDIVFFDASDEVSRDWVNEALSANAIVVDHSGAHRMSADVPLVVPEVNGETIGSAKMVSGPNCTTAQLVMALKPLHDRFGLTRVSVSTYQSVSGAGTRAIEELKSHQGPHVFNLTPQIGSFDQDGVTSEENKVMQETKKILNLPNLKISCTAVRVPTLYCHAEVVSAEFSKPIDAKSARKVLAAFSGVVVQDDPELKLYPMNRTASHQDPVFVGRVRKDPSADNGILFWIVADNLRKGAALNAVQIAERMIDA